MEEREQADIAAPPSHGPSGFSFLRFLIAPVIVLVVMGLHVWDGSIVNLGCVGADPARIFEPNGASGAGCQPLQSEARPVETTTQVPRVALSHGRFEWMAFHMVSLALLPAVAGISLLLMYLNLGVRRAVAAGVIAISAGGFLGYHYLEDIHNHHNTGLLLRPTEIYALSRFDEEFAYSASLGMRLDFVMTTIVIPLLLVASASILSGVGKTHRALSERQLEIKRRHLKIMLFGASLVLTFNMLYWGEWLAWPSRFDHGPRGPNPAEFEAIARGIRLFFGTAFTLALIAFAVPAIRALSRAGATTGAGHAPQTDGYFYQRVLSKEEVGVFLALFAPFSSALLSNAFNL